MSFGLKKNKIKNHPNLIKLTKRIFSGTRMCCPLQSLFKVNKLVLFALAEGTYLLGLSISPPDEF